MEPDNIFAGPYNLSEAVQASYRLDPRFLLSDVTMREGRKPSGEGLTAEEKVELALALDDLGLRQLQVGWPGRMGEDGRAVRAMRQAGVKATIEVIVNAYPPNWRQQVDAAVESGADVVLLTHPTSGIRLRHQVRVSEEQMLDRVQESIEYAVQQGLAVRFSCTDITRTEFAVVLRTYRAAAGAGAARISLSDAVAAASPGTIRYLVSRLKDEIGLPVHVHTHNALGLALANSVAAVEAGAAIVDVSVHGLGEHGGNTALEDMAVALEVLVGVRTGLRLNGLPALSRLIARLFGRDVPPEKSVVGGLAFARAVPPEQREQYVAGTNEPYHPRLVGNEFRFV